MVTSSAIREEKYGSAFMVCNLVVESLLERAANPPAIVIFMRIAWSVAPAPLLLLECTAMSRLSESSTVSSGVNR